MVDEGTQALNISIVEEVKKRPLLYNYKHKDYYKKNLVYAAWEEIGEEVCLSASKCKDRWNCFKTVLRRHLSQEEKGNISRRPYYLREPMQFLMPFMRACDKPGSSDWKPAIVKIESENEPEQSTSTTGFYQAISTCDDDDEESKDLHQESNDTLHDSKEIHHVTNASGLHPALNEDEVYSNLDELKHSSESSSDSDSKHKAKRARLKANYKKKDAIDDQIEANKMFLLSLLPDLNRMNESELRKFKKGVMDSIHSILGRD